MDMSIVLQPLPGLVAREYLIECHSDRASDYYGFGVRLGIYFSWLQGYIANTMLASDISSAADTNTIFILTLFIAMANDSRTRALAQIDGLVLMHLCGGTIFGILSVWGYRTRLYTDLGPRAVGYFGSYGTHIRMVLSLAVSCYGLWFWIYGVQGGLLALGPGDGMTPPNPPECATLYTFLFTKVPATGGIRYYYIVVCASCIAYFGAMLLVSCLSGWFAVERLLGSLSRRWARSAHSSVVSRPVYATGFKSNELKIIYKVLRIANIFWLIFSALMVEFTLNFNNVNLVLGGTDDTSLSLPSQLLPFLVGLFGFTRTLYSLVQEKWFRKPDRGGVISAVPESREDDGDAHDGRRFRTGPSVRRNASDLDRRQAGRSWILRYLVAWLPWLSLLQHYDEQLEIQGISRESTNLSTFASGQGMDAGDWENLIQKPRSMV
ncbi:hypothetical protein CMUS01_12489 [Colletotrichum musicola]|uniref:Uncharacterized protein n=1 Tax=Colletotrichum musicola TaxID=2175873 RepID=A0A8H6N0M8_9PEZI|nr:hypothetical protein CMUS01_12489 [Colletotrichum musicola]